MSNVETTYTHIGARPSPPPAGDNSEKFATGVDASVDTGVDTGISKSVDTGPSKVAKDQLRSVVSRIEAMEEEKKVIADDIRDIYAEAKGNGYDVKALRTIIRLRKMDANDRAEQETILETYMQAMGML